MPLQVVAKNPNAFTDGSGEVGSHDNQLFHAVRTASSTVSTSSGEL